MPWCWRPLRGPYWIDNTRVEDSKENKRQDSKKKEESCSMKTFHLQVNNKKAVQSSSEKPGAALEEELEVAGQENAQGEKPEAGINVNNKFKQIRPGVYTFAGAGAPDQESKESKNPEQFTPAPAPAGIPSSRYGFKKIGVSRDGLPVYTFT